MIHRALLAIMGVALLGVYVVVAGTSGWQGASESFFANAAARVGLVVLVIALAWPHLIPLWRRMPLWFWIAVFVALSLAIVRPRLILLSISLVVAAVLIQGGLGWLARQFGGGQRTRRANRNSNTDRRDE